MKIKKIVFLAIGVALLHGASAFSMKTQKFEIEKKGNITIYRDPKTKKFVKEEHLDPKTGKKRAIATYDPKTDKEVKWETFFSNGKRASITTYDPKPARGLLQLQPPNKIKEEFFDYETEKIKLIRTYNPKTSKLVKEEFFDHKTGAPTFSKKFKPKTKKRKKRKKTKK